jgi:sRNA-binding protein
MSAITTRNTKAHALALLCKRWPKCFFIFPGRRLPLKIGIHEDIPDGLIEPKILRLAFPLYVNNPGYLKAKRLGVARIDLNGEAAGTVGENDAKNAQARLIRKFRKNRKQPRYETAVQDVVSAPPPAPPPRRQQPSQRDSLASVREAARKRRGAA